jgi:hypothetical protein
MNRMTSLEARHISVLERDGVSRRWALSDR